MILSAELFEQIAASLSRDAAAPGVAAAEPVPPSDGVTTEQRRRGPRVAAETGRRARLIPLTDAIASGPTDVALRDVAPGGARFLHATRIPLDEQFVLVLPGTDGPVSILCGVAYWQPVGDNLYAIGARFTRILHQGSPAAEARPGFSAAPVRRAV
jgi:hypothetical protein